MDKQTARTYLDVSLKPSRSLTPHGFLIVMGIASTVSIIAGVHFYLKGAWPVMGFFGLDLALLYWAFKASYRQGEVSERIHLCSAEMKVERTAPGRKSEAWSLHPSWVQVSVENAEEHHATLKLRDRSTALELGHFLPPRERAEVADMIRDGLERRKRALLD